MKQHSARSLQAQLQRPCCGQADTATSPDTRRRRLSQVTLHASGMGGVGLQYG
jgi:hypothetical protein